MIRRDFLRTAFGASATLLLAACSQANPATPTAAPKTTAAPAAAAKPAASPAAAAKAAASPAGASASAGPEQFTASPDLVAAAENEGKLVIYHGGPADAVAKFVAAFNERFPKIDTSETLIEQEAPLMAKIMAESQAGQHIVDIFFSDIDVMMIDLQKRDMLLKYESPQYQYFDSKFLGNPPGYYGPGWVSLIGIAWNTEVIKAADEPKSWNDLLDPKFKGKISVYNSSASSPFNAWYLLSQSLGTEYWDKMADQELRTYESSAQILDSLSSGETPVTMQFNNFRLKDVVEKNLPIKALWPSEGVPNFVSVQGILAKAPHPNAARLFHDWFLSREGMTKSAVEIAGQLALRPDVGRHSSQPDITKVNLLAATDLDAYLKAYGTFRPAWDRIVGTK